MEDKKSKVEIQKWSVENLMGVMREMKNLHSELFKDKEILGMIPEAKGMLEAHEES